MGLYVVYDLKGEMFEVPATKLKYLVVELGWTLSYPPKKVFKD